jgi:protein-S-isoprenylcysteine O-methyltransferase Ste14
MTQEGSELAIPWVIPFYINVVLLVSLVVSFPFLAPGSASYTIAIVSFGIVLFSLALFGVLIRTEWIPFESD